MPSPTDTPRRLALRVVVKSMFSLLFLALLWAMLSELFSSPLPEGDSEDVEVAGLQAGAVLRTEWDGKRILIRRRHDGESEALADPQGPGGTQALADPNSRHSLQPERAHNPWRSLRPEYFVVLDYGNASGCPLELLDGEPFTGFRDSCDGSLFDGAGRVLEGQAAPRNLAIPPHHWQGDLLVLGVNRD